jgi:hypothetical protein
MISKIDIFLYSGNVISQFLEMSYLWVTMWLFRCCWWNCWPSLFKHLE